jgi:Radical SAM superfamily
MARASVLLITPPAAKICEPPAGITRLAGVLKTVGVPFRLLDANLEALLSLLRAPVDAVDTWSRRAVRNREKNLAALKDPSTYESVDRYRRSVMDLNRLLSLAGRPASFKISLSDCEALNMSPLRSADLLHAAQHPELNPFFSYFSDRIPFVIEETGSNVVGLSLTYLSQALAAFAMAGFLRRRFPHLRLILGGGLLTSWMRGPAWKNPFDRLFDDLVAGPGEQFLLDVADAKPPCASSPPAFDNLPLDEYLSPGTILPYSASSGCYWMRCSFCPERAEETAYRPVPPATAAADLQELVADHRPTLLHITDNALSPALLRTLAARPPGAPWYGFARVTPELADLDFCRALAGSGCVMLKLGVESGSQHVLDALGKGTDVTCVSRALHTLKGAGIATYGYLLFGTPAETEDEARETMAFVAAHADCIDFLNVAIFNLPLNSPDAVGLATSSFYEGDLSLYADFIHPKGWTRKHVRRFLDNEFRRHPAIRAILLRNPPFFTSNHAPFFVMRSTIK